MSQKNNTCDCCSGSSSGFVFGLICGAVIAALVAVYIYKNPRSEVFSNLKKKFEDLLKSTKTSPHKSHKKSVVIPANLATPEPAPTPKSKTKKFLKPKK